MPRFSKGRSGNPGGRPKGRRNHSSLDVQALCQQWIFDQDYQARLGERLRRGKVAAGVEALIWYYAFGKPADHLTVEAHHVAIAEDLQQLSVEEVTTLHALLRRAETRSVEPDDNFGACDHDHTH